MLISRMSRTMREDEAGQALVLGAVSMLVLALSVMVTIQLGNAIDQRIRVQNAADNAAFSTAATVARALNFIAWVNRATVSHYVSMMALQSLASFVTGIQTFLWMLSDLMQSIAAITCVIAQICQKCIGVPIVGQAVCAPCYAAFSVISAIADGAAQVAFGILNSTWEIVKGLDQGVAITVEKLSQLTNAGHYGVSWMMKNATGAVVTGNVAETFHENIVKETAGECNEGSAGTAFKVAMGALNGMVSVGGVGGAFSKLFNDKSEDIPEGGTEANNKSYNENDEVQKAERLMAELANATRTGTGGSEYDGVTFETKRGWGDNGLLKYVTGEYQGSTRLVKSMTCQVFTQGTADCGSGGPASGNADATALQNAATACDNDQKKCEDYDKNTYQPAQQACDSANAACSSCTPPDSDTCEDKCDDAEDKCDTADDRKDDRDDLCKKAEKSCDKLQDMGKGSGGSSADISFGGGKNYVFEGGAMGTTQMTQGGAIASTERVKPIGLAVISGGYARFVGIQSFYKANDKNKSFHCRLPDQTNDRHQEIQIWPGCPKYAFTKQTKCENESGRHKWYGIGKYISFRPDPDPDTMFNQPSFWSLVNKSPERASLPKLAFGFGKGAGEFSFKVGSQTGKLTHTKPGLEDELGDTFAGLNAFSRAQVYYHRPGFWAEPPNLFNPFWRAKLGPIAPHLGNVMSQLGAGSLGSLMQAIVTH